MDWHTTCIRIWPQSCLNLYTYPNVILIINNDNQILWTPGILYDSVTIPIAFEIIINPSMPENVNIWLTHWCQEILLSNQLIDTRNVCVTNSVRPGYNVFNSNTFYIDNNCTDNWLKMMWNQTGLIIWTTSATSQYLVWCWTSSGSLEVLCHLNNDENSEWNFIISSTSLCNIVVNDW